jgi:S1-C subfamily serine protease
MRRNAAVRLAVLALALAPVAAFGDDSPQGKRGVRVVEVAQDSPAWQAGLRKGDLIISVNKQQIYSLEDVQSAVDQQASMLLLNIHRGESALFIVIR